MGGFRKPARPGCPMPSGHSVLPQVVVCPLPAIGGVEGRTLGSREERSLETMDSERSGLGTGVGGSGGG